MTIEIARFSPSVDSDVTDSATHKWLSEGLTRELVYNGVRDPTWVAFSALNLTTIGQTAPAWNSQASLSSQIISAPFVQTMGAQWLFGSIPMLILAAGETLYRKMRGGELSSEEKAKIWAPAVAASLAIPMWDVGQLVGAHVGAVSSSFQNSALWYGSSITVGMIAAPFTGMFEGFTQWSVKYVFDVATNKTTQGMWRHDPKLMGKVLAKELVLNTTIGAIPGAVWQIVFFFVLSALVASLGPVGGIILAALLVGVAVMICNYGCAHVINSLSNAIDRKMRWDVELENLKIRVLREQCFAALPKQEKISA